ncbi:MAG: hypothetical protein NUV92_05895 [Ignavibacteria bacterium]|nr:hypothetical protein [Ignavibacteria bacterium]MDH7527555.1 hypothetical protein [Ignavibacteria bacterium]
MPLIDSQVKPSLVDACMPLPSDAARSVFPLFAKALIVNVGPLI